MSTFFDHIPDLDHTPNAICRRKCWEGHDGYPEGEGVTIGEPKEWGYVIFQSPDHKGPVTFVWSRDNHLFAFSPIDLLATDWYIAVPKDRECHEVR